MKQLTLTDEQYADLMEILPQAQITTTLAMLRSRINALCDALENPTEIPGEEFSTTSRLEQTLAKLETLLAEQKSDTETG